MSADARHELDRARIEQLEGQLREATQKLNAALAAGGARREETKGFIKEAFQDWLDAQAAAFGKGSLRWLLRVAVGGLFYFAVTHTSWKIPGLP